MITYGVDSNWGWGGGFYWQGGGAQVHQGEIAYTPPPLFSRYFGWQIFCGWSTCDGNSKPGEISVLGLEIEAAEGAGPSVSTTPGSLGAASGWVRGSWPVAFSADGPSGACQLAATLGGLSISQPVNEPQSPTTWHQCPAGSFSQSFNTTSVGSGSSVPLVTGRAMPRKDYAAGAYLSSAVTKCVNIDNDPVTVSMSGPTDAPTTAGVQYVIATVSAGPSGVAGLSCSLNGAPAQWYPGSTARVAVQNLGPNSVMCSAANNARDAAGNPAWSAPASWTLSIRQPTTAALSFGSRILDALQCRHAEEQVKIPAKWVTVRRHGKRVKVKRPAHTKVVKIVRCHPRVVRVRVRVKINRRPAWRWERRVRLPHTVQLSTWRARYGATAKIVGWLGTSDGVALAGQTVRILTAPNNGLNEFTQGAVAIRGPDGVWSATLPPGLSRLVEAVYDGGSTVEPASSSHVRLIVPALVKLTITPAADSLVALAAQFRHDPDLGTRARRLHPGCRSAAVAAADRRRRNPRGAEHDRDPRHHAERSLQHDLDAGAGKRDRALLVLSLHAPRGGFFICASELAARRCDRPMSCTAAVAAQARFEYGR